MDGRGRRREHGGVLRVHALDGWSSPGLECAHVQLASLLRAARVDGAARTDSTAAQGDGGDRGGKAQVVEDKTALCSW